MSSDTLEKAIVFETIMAMNGNDYKKSYDIYSALTEGGNAFRPFPQVSSFFSSDAMRYEDEWRRIRDYYHALKANVSVIESHTLSPTLSEGSYPIPFLYLFGNEKLLSLAGCTILGPFLPSEGAKRKAMDIVLSLSGLSCPLVSSLEPGLPLFSVGKMLKVKGKVVAVMHTFPLKPDGKEALSTLKGVLENDGLLISPIGLSQRSERWHQALRNRVLATLSSCLVLLEEKDGGPSWKVFDEAEPGTGRFISKSLMDDDTLAFPKARREKGARIYRSFSDIQGIFGKSVRAERYRDLTPELF